MEKTAHARPQLSQARRNLPQEEDEERDAEQDAVDRKGRETAAAHPIHEPRDDAERDDERDGKADREHDPFMAVDGDGRDGLGSGGMMVRHDGFQQVVAGGDDHGGDGEEKRKLQRGGARHACELAGGDGGHGARGAGEYRRQDLARADPDGLRQAHLLHVRHARVFAKRIDQPHDDAADEERGAP